MVQELGGHIHLPCTLAQHGLAGRLRVARATTAVSSRSRPGVTKSVHILRWGETSDARGDESQTGTEAAAC